MSREQDAVAGIELAREAVMRRADGDVDGSAQVFNRGSHAETAWAAAYVLSLFEAAMELLIDDPAQRRLALLAAVEDEMDPLMVRVGLILDASEHGTSESSPP